MEFKSRTAAEESYKKFSKVRNYAAKVPRFTVDYMNQAELLQHIFICGFLRGSEYQENMKED